MRQRPEWHVKIGDFGFSKRVSDSVSAPFSARGTTKYMAPEYRDLMNNCESSDFTTAVDMWSFGCLIYELFAKKCPFDEDDNTALMRYVRSGSFPRQPLDDCGASSESIWLVMNLLRREPHLRLSAHDALHCAWLTTVSSPVASDPMSAPNKAHNLPTSSGLPTLFVISDDASTGNDGNSSSSAHLPARPRPEERAVSSCELPTTHLSSDDAAVPIEKLFQPPQLPARPKSSNTLRTGFLQSGEDKKPAVALIQTQTVSFPDIPVAERMNNMRPAQIARKPVPEAPIHPNLPLLKVTRLGGDYIDMAFANLKFKPQRKPTCDVCESRRVFNPVIKPAAVYYCVECGNRPLCARCIAETIRSPADVHEADHKLQAWIQAHSFPLQEFLDRFQPIHVVLESGVDPSYGKSWLSSDYSFTPPAEGSSGTRWVFNAPAGDFDLSVQLRIIQQEQMVDGSAIGKHKAMMIHARAVHLGSILFGARVIDSDQATDTKSDRHLPDGAMEKSIRSAKEEQKITLKLGFKLKAGANQKIEVHIRGAYDELYFKAGSPFRWCLEQIS